MFGFRGGPAQKSRRHPISKLAHERSHPTTPKGDAFRLVKEAHETQRVAHRFGRRVGTLMDARKQEATEAAMDALAREQHARPGSKSYDKALSYRGMENNARYLTDASANRARARSNADIRKLRNKIHGKRLAKNAMEEEDEFDGGRRRRTRRRHRGRRHTRKH
jgi:hypothetical protein